MAIFLNENYKPLTVELLEAEVSVTYDNSLGYLKNPFHLKNWI